MKDLNLAKSKIYLTNKVVKLKFKPSLNWWIVIPGESIVSIIKRALKLVLKDRLVQEEPLRTFLVALDITLNSLHLLPLSEDFSVLDPLTPNHFLIVTQSLYFNPNIK